MFVKKYSALSIILFIVPHLFILPLHAKRTKKIKQATPSFHDHAQTIYEQKKPTMPIQKSNSTQTKKQKTSQPHTSIPLHKLKESELQEIIDFIYSQDKADTHYLINVLEQYLKISTNQTKRELYCLELADLHYELEHFDQAHQLYTIYAQNYPGKAQNYEYALYQSIVCVFVQTLAPNKEQVLTERTLELCTQFLQKATDELLIKEVKDIQNRCQQLLFDKEAYVFNFYLDKKNLQAAKMRLDYIQEHFKEVIPHFEKKYKPLQDAYNLAQAHQSSDATEHKKQRNKKLHLG